MNASYWYCSYCHSANHPSGEYCGSCGNPKPKKRFFDRLSGGIVLAAVCLFGVGTICGGAFIAGLAGRGSTSAPRGLVSPQASSSVMQPTPTPSLGVATPTKIPALPTATPVVTSPATSNSLPDKQAKGEPNGRVYITGPRGGCYYINSNGNKTYVDRSLCGSSAEPPKSLNRAPSASVDRGYLRGSRGGCYYINSRGNKTYVDRSLCN